MSVRDDLKRKYGGGAVTKFPTATSAATAAAAGRTEQKPTGPSPVRQDAAPRENYSIKPGSVAASLREKYGNDTSAASVERYRERMRRTAQQGLERFRADQKNRETAFSPLAVMDATNPNMDPTARAMWGLAEHYRQDTSWQEPGDDWDEDHLLRFGVLYNSDPKEAASYANQVNNYLNAMKRQSQEQAAAADATKNLGSMLAGTAKSILTAPAGFADFLDNLAELGGRGTTTEKDTLSLYDMGQAASGGITRKLNEKGVLPESIPVIGGKGWGDVYGLGTSALQSMALGNTLGKFGTLTTFLGSAAASAVNEKQAQGEYGPRAVAYGAAAGISEVLSEYIPLGDLLEAGPASGVKDLMKNIIKQGLEETIGEGANSIAAAFADWAIMGDKSEYARLIQEGLNAGLDEKAAQKLALRQIAEDVAFDALGGFATGGMSMGVQQGTQTLRHGWTPAEAAAEESSDVPDMGDGEIEPVEMAVEGVDDSGDFAAAESGKAEFGGKPVTIKGIADTKGDMTLELEDGRTVKASEVLYATEGEALVYEAVASLGAPANIGNILVKNYRDGAETVEAEDYAMGMTVAFNHGRHNLPQNQIASNPYIAKLTDVQRNSAYVLGQRFGGKQVASQEAIARRARFGQRFQQSGKPLTGSVRYDGDVRKLNARQRASVSALEKVADALGVQIHLFESYENVEGQRVYKAANGEEVNAPNGWYNTKTGDIGVDIHAGISGEDTMLFTASHELTHFVKQWSPAKFKVLSNFLMEQYGENGVNVEELIERQQAKAKATGRELSFDEAFEEMVADSMEAMLADGNIVEKLAKLKTQDRSLWEKLRDGIRELTEKIRKVYEGLKPDSREGRYVAEMKDSIERLQELFTEGLEEAGQNFQAAVQAKAGEETAVSEDAAPVEDGGDYDPSGDADIEFSRRDKEKTARMGGVKFSEREEADFAQREEMIIRTVDEAIANKGVLGEKYNQKRISAVPSGVAEMVKTASGGEVDVSQKYIALGGSEVWHEYQRHTDAATEHDRGQIAFTKQQFVDAIKSIYQPDFVECIFRTPSNPTQRQSFAYVKRAVDGHYVVVEAVGGKKNPHIVPVEILYISESKWEKWIGSGKTVGEMLFENDGKKLSALDMEFNKKNRVTAAQFASDEAIANTPHSPRSDNIVAQDSGGVNAKFSLREPVEETKTLIAMHNLTEEKLEKAIDLGGFPMPSIAVTKADIPHTNFGEITLVMDKRTIDPKADRRNDVFSADAWTPTFPRTEYEANTEVEDRVRRTLQELERKIAPQFQGNLRRVMYGLEDLLNSYDGEENLIAHVLDNDGLKAVYLESRGKHIDEVQVEREAPKRYNQAAQEKYEAIIAALGTRDPAEIGTMPLKDIRDNYGAELEKVVPGISKTSLRLSRFMQQTIDYLMDDGSGPETEMVVDQNATRQAMEEALDRDGYEVWVRELFSGIEGDKGIYNGKERFTPSGRSRSFQQTHLPVTLDNIVKAMAAQNGGNTKNASGFNGVKTLRAGTAQRFKSIKGMHDLEGRLQNLTEEEQTALTDGLQSRLYDLIDEIDREAGRKGASNNLIRFDQIGQIITEASETGRYNVSDIQRVFQENHQTISDELALNVKELLFDVSQMPVNLFEAKPRRAVRFDEVRAAVVPVDASEELKRKLEGHGVPVIEYERDNVDDRLRKVNSVEGVKFSERDPVEAKLNRALEKENAAQREEIGYLRELVRLQGKVTNGTKFTRSSVDALAGELMKEAGAKGDRKELAKLLNGVYEYIAGLDDPAVAPDWEDIAQHIGEVAQWLIDHVEVKPDRGEYANDILTELRTMRISLNEGQMSEVVSRYGSYNDFRKANFGSFVLSKDGTPLDMVWQDLASRYPAAFDADVGDADMPLRLAEIVEQLRDTDIAAEEWAYQREDVLAQMQQAVYDGYWRVSTLKTVADRWQGRMEKADAAGRAKLEKQAASYQKQIDELKQKNEKSSAKLKQARMDIAALNAEHADRLRNLRREKRDAVRAEHTKSVEKYRDARKKATEGRNKTAMRHKIQRVVKELNDLLLKPDKKRHVPEGLRKAVADSLAMVNMDTADTEARIARYAEMIAQEQAKETPDQAKIDAYTVTTENLQRQGEKIGARLEELRMAYDKIAKSDDPDTAAAYDENISGCLQELAETIGDTPLGKMTMEQLSDVYDMYTMMLTTIRDSNKTFNQALADGVAASADAARREIESNGKRSRLGVKLVEELKKFGINNLKPTYFFSYLHSRTFQRIYQGLLDGQGKYAQDMDEGRAFRQEQQRKYNSRSWDTEKTWEFQSTFGERFKLNLEQIMSLYAFSKRDQARDHIRQGGIVIDKETDITEVVETKLGFKVKLRGKAVDATAYAIDDVTLDEIIGTLTKDQRGYVDAMQSYLSDVMGAKGNEVSMALYNVKLFKEKNYFPLRSAQEYSVRAREQAEQTGRLKNAGFTKSTTPHAKNPIVLSQFKDVWAGHVQDMSSYHAMTLPLEDLYRVYNYGKNGRDGVVNSQSIIATMQNVFGPQATGYIDQLLKDLNGGQVMDSAGSIPEAMMGKFKKGAVFMSASVLFQQSSSVARALAEIDAKYISPLAYMESLTVIPRQLAGMVNKSWAENHDKAWAELKQYAPIAIIKEMGYFDMNMGKTGKDFLNAEEYTGVKEKMTGMWKDSSYRDEVFSRAPALADELAWCDIWQAVKREQQAKHPELKIKSKEFLELCGKRFTEIIDRTQVYDSVLSRSANMRSRSGTMRMATSFMAEPTTRMNMLADAVMNAKRGQKNKARRIVGAVVAADIINAALAALVYAARDDDEDKEYWEKYLGHVTGEAADSLNPFTYIPLAQDVVSVFQGWDVERADMAVISDLADAWNKLFNEKATTWEKVKAVLGSTSQLLGVPLKNLLKDGEALWRVVTDAFDGQSSTAAGIGYAIRSELPEWIGGGAKTNGDQLYEAMVSGNKSHEQRIRERFKDEDGKIDEGKAQATLRKAIRENDPRIREAAIAWNEGRLEDYMTIAKAILAEKHFHQDDIVSAIRSEASSLQEDSGEEPAAVKHKGLFTGEQFAIAASDGDKQMMGAIKADLIQTAVSNGKSQVEAEQAAVSSIRSAVKEAYIEEGIVTEAQARSSLAGYCGLTEKEAEDTVQEWKFEKENGFPLSELEDAFVGGQVSGDKAEEYLRTYGGYARTEAESKVLQWQCEKNEGIRYDDVQQLYVDGKLTADRARELRVKYGESSLEDARKTVLKWDCEKDTGVKYTDIDVAYLSGDITEKTAIDYLMKYGEKDRDKASLTVQAYRWRDQHTEYKDLIDTAIDRYIDHCEDAGISIPDFYEANKKVAEIREAGGTTKENVVRYIRSLPLSRSQKWAMWYAVKTTSWKDNVSF